MPRPPEIVLWTGPKHSGKSTAAAALAGRARQVGATVAGLLAESVYHEGQLAGFDAVDLGTGRRAPLARRGVVGPVQVGDFTFIERGLALGAEALSPAAAAGADLIIVDEFGPLELSGQGWRQAVDALLASASGLLLLVVRDRLVEAVAQLYAAHHPTRLNSADPDAVDTVLALLS